VVSQELSFSALDRTHPENPDVEKSVLEDWYERLYRVPFDRFSIEDLARATRQKLFPEYIVPYVLEFLKKEPLAGELYEGELLNSLTYVGLEFWQHQTEGAKCLVEIFDQSKDVVFVHYPTLFRPPS
jgi:hypothetical protein